MIPFIILDITRNSLMPVYTKVSGPHVTHFEHLYGYKASYAIFADVIFIKL